MIKFNFIKTENSNQFVIETRRFDGFDGLTASRLTAGKLKLISFKDISIAIILFVVTFVAVFAFMNRSDIFSGLNLDVLKSKEAQEIADNEKLTAELRAIYGYNSGFNQNSTSNNILPVQPQNTPGNSTVESNIAYAQTDNSISIPKVGINAPIIRSKTTDSKTILNDLTSGVVLYPESSLPGNSGTAVIIGHSSSNLPWRKYSSVFAPLSKLSPGDLIHIKFMGRDYTYVVQNKYTGTVNDLQTRGINSDLVLGTCWPIGDDKERILITASLQRN